MSALDAATPLMALVLAGCADASAPTSGSSGSGGATSSTSVTTSSSSVGSTSESASSSSSSGAGGQSGCPSGSALVAAVSACSGAAPSPPAALTTALSNGQRGDVIGLGGFAVPSAPCAPLFVCRPNDAPTLLFSDEPETTQTDGIVYADTIAAGRYRAYVYHVNAGTPLRKFPVVVLNQGAATATITIEKRGIAGPNVDYPAAGKAATLAWLSSNTSDVLSVPAGKRVLLDADLDSRHAAKNELVNAILDFSTDAPLKLSVVSVAASADAATITAGLSVVPDTGLHVRGTFPGADFTIVGAFGALDGVRSVSLGSNTVDPDLAGHSAVDGGKAVTLSGNFGVAYTLDAPISSETGLAISPRGGAWAGGAVLGGGLDAGAGSIALPKGQTLLDAGPNAIHLGRFAAGGSASGRLMTGGGTSLPIALLFVPLGP